MSLRQLLRDEKTLVGLANSCGGLAMWLLYIVVSA